MNQNQNPNPYYQQSSSDQIPRSVGSSPSPKKKFDFKNPYFLLGGVLVVFIIFIGLGLTGIGPLKFSTQGEVAGAKSGEWQAVFLSNGQVYFGHLDKGSTNSNYLILNDIYYLKEKNTDLSQSTKNKEQVSDTDNLQLVKLGNELHGPEDEMKINRDQVLFWENLKPDGKVVQAIINTQYAE